MDINRLRKLSGISEDPMQVPPKKRPPMPRPGMPTPDKPSPAPFPSEPYPVPGGPPPKEPDRPQPMPGPKPGKPKRDRDGREIGVDTPPMAPKKDYDPVMTSPSLRDYLKMVRR